MRCALIEDNVPVGAALYALGRKYRYVHSVFHIFVVIGSVLHFFCIFFYVI